MSGLKVKIHTVEDRPLKYVVIAAYYKDQWLMVRHKDRSSYEIPGGHIETGETPDEAGRRELYEETGALSFDLRPIGDYSVSRGEVATFGRLYIASIDVLGDLPESEIVEVKALSHDMLWTYEAIQPILFEHVKAYI